MADKVFVDTNILIYAYDSDVGDKHVICKNKLRELWDNEHGVISTQVLQEFYVNVTKKIPEPITLSDARRILKNYEAWQVELINPRLVGLHRKFRKGISYHFGMHHIVAAAIQGNAKILLSEDLNSGQMIEGVEVVSPF